MPRRAAQGTGNIAQKGGSFNIGVEGQFLLGAAAATLTGIYVTGLPSFLHIPLCLLAAALAGALYSFIPTFLHIKRGASLLMIFLLMNSIATFLMQYIVLDRFASKDSLVPSTDNILATAELPYLIRRPNKLSSRILVVLLCAVILYFFYQKTTAGYDRKGGITVNGTLPCFLPIVLSIIRLSTPIFVACMGNMFCERVGALNLGSEGMMVSGAFSAPP